MIRLSKSRTSVGLRAVPIALAAIGFLTTYYLRQGTAGIPQLPPESLTRVAAAPPLPAVQSGPAADPETATATAPPAQTEATPEAAAEIHPVPLAATESTTPADASTPSSENSSTETEVPVAFTMQDGPDQPASRAILRNQSAETLHLAVTALDSATGNQSEVQVVLRGRRQADLTAAGLIVEPGSQIRIHSDPYHDQTFRLE